MRRALELLLMLGGALAFAICLDLLRAPAEEPWPLIAMAGCGWAAFMLGVVIELRKSPSPAAPKPSRTIPSAGPLGAATLVFRQNAPPEILSRDSGLEVIADGDGTVRLKLKGARATGRLICRSDRAAYFNTLRRSSEEAAIKLIGPVPPLVRIELWDGAQLKAGA